jgi:hypothetical protein
MISQMETAAGFLGIDKCKPLLPKEESSEDDWHLLHNRCSKDSMGDGEWVGHGFTADDTTYLFTRGASAGLQLCHIL